MDESIKSFSLASLQELMRDYKQPSFRAKQLFEWLYLHHASSYDEMTNLPKALRDQLEKEHPLYAPAVVDEQTSRDGTVKYVIQFHDGACVETVAIPSEDGRLTVCCSSQVGCAMGCTFCATGKEGFTRNLVAGEIVDQIFIVQERLEKRVSNVVVMGQGEPFLNYDNTLLALRILNQKNLLNIGARHIVVSTCGILPGIDKFSQEPEQFTLAISLHAANQTLRNEIMPAASKYTLPELKKHLLRYVEKTNRRVTLEYALIKDVNDSTQNLNELIDFCSGLLCHVNLIPLNEIDSSSFKPSTAQTMNKWFAELNRKGIEATIRHSRGADIAGACGQLKNKRN